MNLKNLTLLKISVVEPSKGCFPWYVCNQHHKKSSSLVAISVNANYFQPSLKFEGNGGAYQKVRLRQIFLGKFWY
jgi:hypothetical protein